MKKSMIIFLAALVIVFIGCVKDLNKEGICETTKLIGRVIEESTQNPVAGVKVSVTNGSRTYVSCITEREGNFDLQVNFDKIDKDYYLLMDGGTAAKTKKTELHGMGMEMYDYTNIILYNSLETDGLPVISLEITSISAHSAVCKAKIIAGTDVNVTKRGFCWSSSNENPTISNHVLDNGSGAGNYTGEISGLAQNTTYYVRAYAQTTDTIVYSNPKSFKTYALPSVMTILVTNITTVSAECRGEVLSDGGSTVTERGVCYGLAPNPTINNSTLTSGTGMGSFTCELTGLTKNTKYYVKAYAKNSYGVAYGEEKSFTTNAFPTFQYGGYTYYVAPEPGNRMDWSAANSYCNNLSLEGMSGWKMPTRDELVQMYADRKSIGGFVENSAYWSSTQESSGRHWGLRFGSGDLFSYSDAQTLRVRPIRRKN